MAVGGLGFFFVLAEFSEFKFAESGIDSPAQTT
jgi:hypothetical protein